MALAIVLSEHQIESARRMFASMPRWQLAEGALVALAEAMPAFDLQACLVKTVAVNSIFGTQVLATMRMAEWVHKLLGNGRRQEHGIELVETMAALKPNEGDKQRVFTSFAAKFCHFFVDGERYPIYDDAARQALRLHLGKSYVEDPPHPYTGFCAGFDRLRTEARLEANTRELDRYLWLMGMYLRWHKARQKNTKPIVNEELGSLLNAPTPKFAKELKAMLPSTLRDAFKGDL